MKKSLHALCGILIGCGILAAASALTMLLWNLVIPSVSGWTAINFWQALGLFVLLHLLTFPLLPHHGGRGGHSMGRMSPEESRHWHESMGRLRNRMQGMSREEKLQFLRERLDVKEGD